MKKLRLLMLLMLVPSVCYGLGDGQAFRFATQHGGSGSDPGSIVYAVAGTYTHTFLFSTTVTLTYIVGAGAGGTNGEPSSNGGTSTVTYSGSTKATAVGGAGYYGGSPGSSSNSIGGANNDVNVINYYSTTGIPTIVVTDNIGAGGSDDGSVNSYGNIECDTGFGGLVTGGSFAVVGGQTITVVVGAGGASDDSNDGNDGGVSLSWL